MLVCGLTFSGGNLMDIHIEESTGEGSGFFHSCFFCELSESACKGAGVVGVDVSPRLQPTV